MCGGSSEINYWLLMANLANIDMFGKEHKINYVKIIDWVIYQIW